MFLILQMTWHQVICVKFLFLIREEQEVQPIEILLFQVCHNVLKIVLYIVQISKHVWKSIKRLKPGPEQQMHLYIHNLYNSIFEY